MYVFSATQVDTYLLCPRKWAWQKIDGLTAPPSPSLALGSAVHAELEGWLRDGKPLNLLSEAGQIAMAGLHHLPAPGTPGLLVEQPYQLELWGYRFRGAKDWQVINRRPPLVGDHKTCKDFRWAKTPEILKTDVQACLYAADAMIRADATECDLQWTYFKTSGSRDSKPVHLRVTIDDITSTLERIVGAASEMTLIRRSGVRAAEVPINADACEAFGGCPFQSNCNLSPEERFRAMMNQQKTSDFLAQLQQRAGATGINPPPVAPAAAPPGPPPTPVQNPVTGAWELPASAAAPPPPPAPAPATPPPGALISEDGRMWWSGSAWMPVPSAPPAPPPAAATPPAAPAEQPAKRGPGRPRKGAQQPAQAPAEQPAQIVPDTPITRAIYTNGPTAPAQPAQSPTGHPFIDAAAEALASSPRLVGDPAEAAADDEHAELKTKVATLLRQAARLIETAAAIAEEL